MALPPPVDIELLMRRIRGETAQQHSTLALVPSAHYQPGTLLRFGVDGNALPYTGAGWSHPEAGFRWTDGPRAELSLDFDKPPGDLVLSFTAQPFLGGGVTVQEVSASWNGVLVGEWTVREAKSFHTLILSSGEQDARKGRLQFNFPTAFSPASMSVSSDPRQLGLAFHELVLRPAHELGL